MLPVLTVLARSPTLAGPADIPCLALRGVSAVATPGHQRRRGGRAVAAILRSVAVAGIGISTASDRRAIGGRAAVAAVDLAAATIGDFAAFARIADIAWHAGCQRGDARSTIDRATTLEVLTATELVAGSRGAGFAIAISGDSRRAVAAIASQWRPGVTAAIVIVAGRNWAVIIVVADALARSSFADQAVANVSATIGIPNRALAAAVRAGRIADTVTAQPWSTCGINARTTTPRTRARRACHRAADR